MSDFKSKLPDLKELGSMTGKLFHDLKTSVGGIIEEYKKKREVVEEPTTKPAAEKPVATEAAAAEKPKKAAAKKAKPTDANAKTDE